MTKSAYTLGVPDAMWTFPISGRARDLWAVIRELGGDTEEGCAATNLKLAEELGVLPRAVSAALIELRKHSLVYDKGTRGGVRRLYTSMG